MPLRPALLLLLAPLGLGAQQPPMPAAAVSATPSQAPTSHGWPVLGPLTHLCDGRVYGTASEISWEVFTSPDSTDQVLGAYRLRLGAIQPEPSAEGWRFRVTEGERTTRVLTIGTAPPFVQRECPAPPAGTRTFVVFSQMMSRK